LASQLLYRLNPPIRTAKGEDSEVILLRGILLASQLLYRLNPPIRTAKGEDVDLLRGILLVIKLAFNYKLESLC
jgi:hypothetical protein